MATTLATTPAVPESREVLRCERCRLVQFKTATVTCRRCRKPLEVEEPVLAPLQLANAVALAPQEPDVAQAVRTLRRARGLSQRQLACHMLVPRTYISKIENSKAMPTLSSLQRLATALEAPIGELLQDAGSRRDLVLAEILSDPFLHEMLPFIGSMNAFQQRVLLSHARGMARDGSAAPMRHA